MKIRIALGFKSFILCFTITTSFAEVSSVKRTTKNKIGSLPACVNGPVEIKKIVDLQIANKKNENKYKGIRGAIKEETDTSLLARLVYAETLAAQCADLNQEILPGIAEVIGNRVRARKGHVRSVIFQRDQFASSLNTYKKSRVLDFLCPKDTQLWALSVQAAKKVLSSDPVTLPKNAYNYYLYLHEPTWPVADWADRKKNQPVRTSNFTRIDNCVRFFNHLKFN